MRPWLVLLLASVASVPPGMAAEPNRFPQPVVVGQLIGLPVLQPVEAQNLLGRVRGVVRLPDGGPGAVIGQGGWFGLGERPVLVPLTDLALLGPAMTLVGLSPEALRALPTADPTSPTLAPDAVIRVGLARPSH